MILKNRNGVHTMTYTTIDVTRNDMLAWCHEELKTWLIVSNTRNWQGNKPVELLNIAAQMSVIVSQLALAAR